MPDTVEELDEFERQELITEGDKDKTVNEKFDWSKKQGKPAAQDIQKRVERHTKFYNGDQMEYQVPKYKSNSVINYIMPGVINVVGLLTDASFEPQVHPLPTKDPNEYEKNREKSTELEKALVSLWQDKGVPEKMVKALYKYVIEEDVVIVPKWNVKEDDVDFEVSPVSCWYFAPGSGSMENSPWAIRITGKDWNFFAQNFPKRLEEIKEVIKEKTKDEVSKGKFEVEEYFTDETYVMRIADVILKKTANPYFEFRDKKSQLEAHEEEGLAEDRVPLKEVKNYFKRPKKPVIQLSAYNAGEIYSRSRMDQLLKPQIDLNKRIQQIDDNLILGGSGRLIYDTLLVSEEEMDKVTFAPFQKIGVPGGKDSLQWETGEGLPPGMIENFRQLQRVFDDISGTHDVSRGQKGKTQTGFEANLLKEADQTSVRLLARNYQTALTKLMQYWTQLISLFYTIEHHFQWTDELGAKNFITLTNEDVSPGMHVAVKVGAQLSKDKADQRAEVGMLAQAGQVDPYTMFETLGYQNPKKLANRLANWNNHGVISDEEMPATGEGQNNEQVLRQQAALAAEENERMAAGEPVPVNPDDVTNIHMEIHEAFPEQTELHQAHIAEHQEAGQDGGGQVAPGSAAPPQE